MSVDYGQTDCFAGQVEEVSEPTQSDSDGSREDPPDDPLLRFKALSPEVQEAILDKHRNWNVDDGLEWWDGIYEQFVDDMRCAGILVHTNTRRTSKGRIYEEYAINFSGFWSQGDGAAFEGHVDDWDIVLENYPLLLEHHREIERFFSWEVSGRNNLCFQNEVYAGQLIPDEDAPLLRQIAAEQLVKDLEEEFERFCDDFEQVIHGYCHKLYRDLEEEYDYLTSDECVLDSLIANDMLNELIEEYEDENIV